MSKLTDSWDEWILRAIGTMFAAIMVPMFFLICYKVGETIWQGLL